MQVEIRQISNGHLSWYCTKCPLDAKKVKNWYNRLKEKGSRKYHAKILKTTKL